MSAKPPYLSNPGTLKNALEKIKVAATPPRFTNDFVQAKLKIKGGAGRAVAPFLKKTGFLNADGTPTALYDRFRNPASSGAAAAEALRIGYKSLYEINEYVHQLNDTDLKGLIVQVTGLEEGSSVLKHTVRTFKQLKGFADFDALTTVTEAKERPAELASKADVKPRTERSFNLGYTINLNLPATTNIEVFDAIFKSLKEHLLDGH